MNPIKHLFNEIKAKVGQSELTVDMAEKILENINEVEKMATRTNQLDLLANLRAQHSFTTRIIEDIIPNGFDRYIELDALNKILDSRDEMEMRPLLLKPLSEFSRPIPPENSAIIEKAVENKIFDDIMILYTDYTGKDREVDKKAQKEKDPIAFGVIKYTEDNREIYSNKAVFITDWVDELCDLTLDKLLNEFEIGAWNLSDEIETHIVDGEISQSGINKES